MRCWGQDEGGEWALHPAGAFTAISAGYAHSCGLRLDGTVACWGTNYSGVAGPPQGPFATTSIPTSAPTG